MSNIKENPYIRVCDLFACGGGLSCGLNEIEGIEVVVGNEIDKKCQDTYKYNHPNTDLIKGDITKSEIKTQIIDSCKKNKVNVIVGGIPCKPFSMAGKRDIFDNRGQLYHDYFEIVEKVNPDICLIENVKGLYSMKHLDITNKEKREEMKKDHKNLSKKKFQAKYNQHFFYVKDKWVEIFNKLGYHCEYKLLKTSNFGVPQHRERLIFLASKKNKEIIWPKETHNEKGTDGMKKWKTAKEAIDDLKDLKEDKNFSHIFRNYKNKPETPELIKKCEYGKSYSGYGEANKKLHPNKPSNTAKENHGAVFCHYEKPRHITPRELARLQSFPDTFLFKHSKGQALKDIGNAVPPLLGKILGQSIKQMFDIQEDNIEELIIEDEDNPQIINKDTFILSKFEKQLIKSFRNGEIGIHHFKKN